MLSAICFNLDQSKILSYGEELETLWEYDKTVKAGNQHFSFLAWFF